MTIDEFTTSESDQEERATLPDEAVVIRGGLSTPDTLRKTAIAHHDLYGEFAISVRASPAMTADELAHVEPPLPQSKLRETRAGAIRDAGFDVIPDEPPPAHALIVLGLPVDDDYLRISATFGDPRTNPAYRKEEA